MGRMYRAAFGSVAVSAQQDLFEVLAPSNAIVIVHRIQLSQSTEVGDAAEEGLHLQMVRGEGSTSGSGGSTPTVTPIEAGTASAGVAVEANNTTKMTAGGGSLAVLEEHVWNVRVPLDIIYTPEERPIISPSDYFTVELNTTPADSLTMSGTITLEEIGG